METVVQYSCAIRIVEAVAIEAVLNDLVSTDDLMKFEKKFQSWASTRLSVQEHTI